MRGFLSPGERRLLAQLDGFDRDCLVYPTEGSFVRALIEEFDAHLDPADEPVEWGAMQARLEIDSKFPVRDRP